MLDFLDALDAAPAGTRADERVLAALGPRMLELARDRAPAPTRTSCPPITSSRSRRRWTRRPLLAPSCRRARHRSGRARDRAQHIATYMTLPNYTNNLLRLGFTDDDFSSGGSDRLVDAIVAWGDLDAIKRACKPNRDAGADHVCVQVIPRYEIPLRSEWRELATALL